MDRASALALLKKYTQSESLLRHALAVEAVMRHYAGLSGADPELWGMVGLLHDIDYEQWPQEHCKKAPELLRAEGFDETFIRAVQSHGWGICTDVEPQTALEKTLFTIDEITGLVAATVRMLPSQDINDLKLSSLKKKWKDKRFAAGVDRQIILKGIELLGSDLDTVLTQTIEGMKHIQN